MENCSKTNEKRCTMPYSMSQYNVGVVTLFISAIINVTNILLCISKAALPCFSLITI